MGVKHVILAILLVPTILGNTSPPNSTLTRSQAKCLYENVYHEARGELWEGQVAVARVTLNRAGGTNTLCDVVRRPGQFSWVGRKGTIKDAEAYYKAHLAAHAAFDYELDATHYHATYVKPKWSKRLRHIKTIGKHKFYD